MNKVDVMDASPHVRTEPARWIPDPAQVTHAPYRRELYIRVTWHDGTVRDRKAMAWTREAWVPVAAVTRIPRVGSN